MKEDTACFTGHRMIPQSQSQEIRDRLEKAVGHLIKTGYVNFLAGGALGFDTMAAETVLSLKEKYPHVRLFLILPCISQAKNWSEADRRRYQSILIQADQVTYAAHAYRRGCMHARNRQLVEESSACVYYLTKQTGGTAYTVEYAKKKGLLMIPIGEPEKESAETGKFLDNMGKTRYY